MIRILFFVIVNAFIINFSLAAFFIIGTSLVAHKKDFFNDFIEPVIGNSFILIVFVSFCLLIVGKILEIHTKHDKIFRLAVWLSALAPSLLILWLIFLTMAGKADFDNWSLLLPVMGILIFHYFSAKWVLKKK